MSSALTDGDSVRRRATQLSTTIALLAVASCGSPAPPAPRPPAPSQIICGTVQNPVRVVDEQCEQQRTDVRWYSADPQGLDADDYTAIGAPLDDDYLGEEDDYYVAPRARVTRAPQPTVRATPTTPRATPSSARSTPTVDRPTRRVTTPARRR